MSELDEIMSIVKMLAPDEDTAFLNPELIGVFMEFLNEYQGSDDKRIKMLSAIKHNIDSDEQARVEKAIQIVKLSKLVRLFMKKFMRGENNVQSVSD